MTDLETDRQSAAAVLIEMQRFKADNPTAVFISSDFDDGAGNVIRYGIGGHVDDAKGQSITQQLWTLPVERVKAGDLAPIQAMLLSPAALSSRLGAAKFVRKPEPAPDAELGTDSAKT